MHDHLWAGIGLKLEHARFFYSEMSRVLQPARSGWERAFYANLDAFLVMTRSVPEIIEFCFGRDRLLKKSVFEALGGDEQTRRLKFSEDFEKLRNQFQQHPLSNQRNISFHRTGYPDVEVKITGRFGVDHIGNPVKSVSSAESRPLEDIGNDPAKMFAATLPPLPVEPRWSDFSIDGKPLFDECNSYLDRASELVSHAQEIAQRVHGDKPLTMIKMS